MPWDARIRRRLKLRDLDTFLAVAEWGSMAKAATHLCVSQPAVSNAIADIEHTLGVRLLDRTAKGVEPTLYGRALLKWAVAMFDDVRQGVKEIEYLTDPTTGEARIGANEPLTAGFLPAVFDRLSYRHPGLTFHVMQSMGIGRAYNDVRARNVDVFIGRVDVSEAHEDIAMEILFDDPLFVVSATSNRWARRRKIKFTELANEPWAVPRPETVTGSHVVEAFRICGLGMPRSAVICNSIEMRYALVETGRFLAVLPRSMLQFNGNRRSMKVLPVVLPSGSTAAVGLVTLKNRTLNPVAKLFIEHVREAAKPLAKKKL